MIQFNKDNATITSLRMNNIHLENVEFEMTGDDSIGGVFFSSS